MIIEASGMEAIEFEIAGFTVRLYLQSSDMTHLYVDDQYIETMPTFVPRMVLPHEDISDRIQKELERFWWGNSSLTEDLNEAFEPMVAEELYRRFERFFDDLDYEYQDNYRFCRVGDPAGEKDWRKRRDRGCCGSYDDVIEIDDVQYRIGFNYGH